jgi:hypothetical protein
VRRSLTAVRPCPSGRARLDAELMPTKPSYALSMRDRLSHLSFDEARKILGRDGKDLLIRGGCLELASPEDLRIDDEEARVDWDLGRGLSSRVFFDASRTGRLRAECSACSTACVHVGGLLSILLERKSDLGLAAPPPLLARSKDEGILIAQALEERRQRARAESMRVRSSDPSTPWTTTRSRAPSAARPTASRCAARRRASRTARAPTSRRTRSGRASTS